MFNSLGDRLQALCESAADELIIVAPFMKYRSLNNILQSVSSDLVIHCVTRWRPDEIAIGVSDIDIWLLLRERPNTSLRLRSDLHAKYYRADEKCFVGSANLTDTALGWTNSPNFELLISTSSDELQKFERELMKGCVSVDDNLYMYMKAIIEEMKVAQIGNSPVSDELLAEYLEEITVAPAEAWLPTLRHPEKLYRVYKGNLQELGIGSRIAAISDLQALQVAPQLNESEFNNYVGILLLQKPLILRIDKFVAYRQRFGAVREFLESLPCQTNNLEFDSSIAWQTTMRWLIHFLPNRYKLWVDRRTEMFSRI